MMEHWISSSAGRYSRISVSPPYTRDLCDTAHSVCSHLSGWFIELHAQSAPEVWVLDPKILRAYIEREPVGLKTEDVAGVAARIIKDLQKL